jgi:hypothetical protein
MDKDEKKRWDAKKLLAHPFLHDADLQKKEFATTVTNYYKTKDLHGMF